MNITLASIQQAVGGKIDGDANLSIHGVNDLHGASNDEITFAESERNLKQAESTGAGAVVVPVDFPALPGKSLLRSARPKETFVRIMLLFNPPQRPINGVHPDACIAPDAKLGQNVAVAERAVLRPGVQVGDNTVIESGTHLGRDVTIGADCLIGPNVVLYPDTRLGDRVRIQAGTVIGGDGFGNLWTGEQHQGPATLHIQPPLELLPLYIRGNSMIPMGPDMAYVGEKPFDPITLDIWLVSEAECTVYDDDEIVTCRAKRNPNEIILELSASGKSFIAKLNNTGCPTEVVHNGVVLPRFSSQPGLLKSARGWYFDPPFTVFVKFAGLQDNGAVSVKSVSRNS